MIGGRGEGRQGYGHKKESGENSKGRGGEEGQADFNRCRGSVGQEKEKLLWFVLKNVLRVFK